MGTWRIQNLVACADRLHRQLWEASDPTKPSDSLDRTLQGIGHEAAGHAATVDRLAREAGAQVIHLPRPSLQAYGWMRWLGASPRHPGDQADSLRRLRRIGEQCGEALCWAELKPMRVLLRSRRHPPHFELQVNALFVSAPDDVLEAVYQRGRGQARPMEMDLLDDYARGADALSLHRAMRGEALPEDAKAEEEVAPPADRRPAAGDAPLGRHQDLRAVFHRVNQQYFQGRLDQPHLRWSQGLNRTHLGHYRPLEDELQVSARLDRRDVPAEVLDFLMFHELLHKVLGISTAGGRRRSHTPAFRAAEALFPRRQQVERWLRRHL